MRPRSAADGRVARRRRAVTSAHASRDAGFSMLEVVVAFAVFAIVATGALTVLGAGIRVAGDDAARLVATNLASRELEITRNTFSSLSRGPDSVTTNAVTNPSPLTGGTPGGPLVVDGIPYTVVRTAQWAAVDRTTTSTCDDGSSAELAYLTVTVDVSWPGLGTRPPVSMSTTLTPSKGTYSGIDGHLGVKVIDSLGVPRSGVTVTATGPVARSGVSGADGCVLLAFVPTGSYALTLSAAGFVNPAGDSSASATLAVQSGELARTTLGYDRAARLDATFVTAPGYATPVTNDLPLSLANSAITPSGVRVVPGSTGARTIGTLWPFPSGYQVWAGACADNDPQYAGAGTTPGQRAAPVASAPGGSAGTTVELAALSVRGAVGATVVARQPAGTTCPPGARVVLGTIPSGGVLKTSLPWGSWTLSTTANEGNTSRSVVQVLTPPAAGSTAAHVPPTVTLP